MALIVLGCDATPPRRDCFARVWVPSSAGDVRIVGSWSDWTPGDAPEQYDGEWRLARMELPPGEHGYLLQQQGGSTVLDPWNPLTTWRGEQEVSLLLVPDCSIPAVTIESIAATESGDLHVEARFLAACEGSAVDASSVEVTTGDGRPLDLEVDTASGHIAASARGLGAGKHTVTVRARDEDQIEAESARASAWASAKTLSDGVIYQVVLDRFRGDGGAVLAAPETPGSRAGGTLDGLRTEIEAGTFEALGVTALLLSPVYDNPEEPRPGLDGRLYQGYHGYWVGQSREVEPALGGAAALEAVVQEAHGRSIGVLLDVVPNHMHEDNARYAEHRDWFQSEMCVCGQAACPWSTHMQTCSFTSYLPDVRWQEPAAMRTAAEDALWWMDRFDVDGIRIDAVPMMPRAATRRIAHALRDHTFPREASFVTGEVFTGPGKGALGEIAYHLGPAGLDGAYDFPLMWALRDAIATGEAGFAQVESILAASEQRYEGSGVMLVRMLNNHDTARFISVAAGDAYGDTWAEPAEQPSSAEPYQRLAVAFTAVFTLPGVPLLYHGDEIGLAGGGDPDSRRVVPGEADLLEPQRALRERIRRLAALRGCSESLRHGDRQAIAAAQHTYAYVRGAELEQPVVVILSAAATQETVALPSIQGPWMDVLSGDTFESGVLAIEMAPLSSRILVRPDDPCR